jgi:hypothetical protein
MPKNEPKSKVQKKSAAPDVPAEMFLAPPRPLPPPPHPSDAKIPASDAFLEEAKNEPKRKLITDHIETINVLRNEKRFTFRAIAEWLTERGIETDHSAVYRAYLAAIPHEERDPREPWDEEVDVPE